METIIEWIGTILGLLGGIFIIRKNRMGFMLWVISDVFMIVLSVMLCRWGILIQFIAFTILSTIGWLNWGKK